MESTWNPHGIHMDLFHMESTWNPHEVHVDSMWNAPNISTYSQVRFKILILYKTFDQGFIWSPTKLLEFPI